MDVKSFEVQWGGKTLTVETGKLALPAGGACTVRYGDTVVLATCTKSPEPRDGVSFFPLSVEYEERLYASGKIKGSRFIKREGRPADEAVMTGRMIDRAMRPLFPYGIVHEVQVMLTVLSADLENNSDIVAMIAGFISVAISDVPWNGPIGGIRIGRVDGEWVINPTFEAMKKSDMDVVLAGTPDKIVMLEANAHEIPEEEIDAAIQFGQKHLKTVIDLMDQVVAAVGKKKCTLAELSGGEDDEATKKEKAELVEKARAFLGERIEKAFFGAPKETKSERRAAKGRLKHELDEMLKEQQVGKDKRKVALEAVEDMIEEAVSKAIIERGQRVDGRSLTQLREIGAEVGLLPRTHGSGFFRRGETHVLSTVTLGSPSAAQIIDGMEEEYKKRYMHHYYFPHYSVGETGRVGGAGRREIGHGGLAERALMPVLPDKEVFPYTIRVVSEVVSSNGSSSQASACGSTLALMDAGVPIKRPVAGIAMGIATDEKTGAYKILTDLQDLEDGEGGMDFKIAGSEKGITTIQLDTKTAGLSQKIVTETLAQARPARMEILAQMAKAIAAPRAELSQYAPRLVNFLIPIDKIREVIGPGGKVINEIIDATGVTIDIEQDGMVTVCSTSGPAMDEAVTRIKRIVKGVEVGELFKEAKIVRIMDFGAFAALTSTQDGLIHISELAPWRVGRVTDMVNVGDIVPVKVIQIDEMGRVNLSLKRAKEELGIPQEKPEGYDENASRPDDRGPRRDDRRGPPNRGPRRF
jgi:polyribonucleotide nucleotidyltransferase